MAVPSELPTWATAGSAEITEPTDQEKLSGWVQEDVPPHQYVNWFWNLVSLWLAYFVTASRRWDTLDEFIAGTVEGDTGIVAEYDGDVALAVAISTVTPPLGATFLAVNGQYVFVMSTDTSERIYVYSRDLATLVRTIDTTVEIRIIAAGGDFVVSANDQSVNCWEVSDGSLRWTYNHGATVRGVCADGAFVYLCGAASGGMTLRKLNAVTGALQWSFAHSGDAAGLYAIATDGQRVYTAGAASSYASGATMRAIDQSSGADLTGEGGLGTAGVGYAWNIAGTPFASIDGCLATDGRVLLVGHPTASANCVQVLSASDGASLMTLAAASSVMSSARQCAIDTDLMIVVGDDGAGAGAIEIFDKRTFARIAHLQPVNDYEGVASDGARLYVAGDNIVRRVSRGTTRPRVWRRVDPTDRYLPYRLLAIPEE